MSPHPSQTYLHSENTGTETTLPYFYVGIKADDPEIQATGRVRIKSPEELDAEFGCSMENVSSDPQRLERWLEAMRIVSSDPGIADMGIHGMFLEQVAGAADRMLSAFARMSSGHKIVLLTLTKLVENVSERSLVLIDEPETHLHPPLLGSFIRALSNLLVSRNAVAVVATYSPVVLQEVPASCVSLLMRSGASLMALAMMIAGAMAQADIEPSDGGPAALLVFEFPSAGPWGNEIAGALGGLAEDIATEQGLIWKVWTEASDRGVAGGVYLFEDVQTARVYVAKHSARLAELGVTGIDVREFSVNEPLSIVTRGR